MYTTFSSNFLRTLFSQYGMLFFKIVTVILIFFWVIRKIILEKKIINSSSISIVEKIPIGSSENIIIINLKEVRLVLGVTSKNISLLYTLSPKKEQSKKTLLVKAVKIDDAIKQFAKRIGIKK
ncbi:hypothetical protein XW81_00380 [Buchnera aphidicola (Schlechtendalia chinensis)]|uniref:Flagellar protein n=1 Tax=Buchnera aphidicola subsp. Schlechtendalia chinensis TaxID=118110 RepID=A0A172WD51_BUCSC|nr:flagellar biosynthetic protein FliO [Buchnera aphidicola]ANF16891.1 hypothetical protein XW81_00380 [Buchnera aphidicola (Schlechtendalia chinensis)]